jgi:hypothetical protein
VIESEEYENNHAVCSGNSVTWHRIERVVPATGDIFSGKGGKVQASAVKTDTPGYEDLESYSDSTPTRNEPYDDLQKYKPVALEEDASTVQSAQQQYTDLAQYSSFRYLEPNGRPVIQEQTEITTEAAKYQPFRLFEDTRAVLDEPRASPEELSTYQPFGYNEPDGKAALVAEQSTSYDPQEVQQYQAFRYNEPDGKPEAAVQGSDHYDPVEVQSYQAFGYNEPDGKPPVVAEEGGHYDPAEVQSYQAFRYHEPDGKPESAAEGGNHYDPTEVQSYQAIRHNEPDGKPLPPDGNDMAEVREYQQPDLSSADAHISMGEAVADAAELETYKAVKYNEPDGKASEQQDSTARALNEFDELASAGQRVPYLEPSDAERAEDLDLLRASDIRATFGLLRPEAAKLHDRDSLESAMSRHAASSDVADCEAASSLKATKQRTEDKIEPVRRQLTGNYVRDFPEEFARSWSAAYTPEQPTNHAVQLALDRQNKPQVLQPALNRQAMLSPKPAGGDLFSKEPQGLETAYEKECAATLNDPIFVKEYGSVEARSTAATTMSFSESRATEKPMLYKILAYDQATQTINTAETTSHVSETQQPALTPAEVLLRLSHPAKFVPHFAPLQAQGFEIVSGSGDVLVFRKMAGDGSNTAIPSTTTERAAKPTTPHLINPIDMTGARREFPDPATSRFASPTGFVNFDMPAPAMSQPAQTIRRFVSGIDVRREEPVFSGGDKRSSPRGEANGKGKKGLGKRMAVGAVWVMGFSYALGVMGEYFRTGGSDGLGPRGF